MSWVDKNVHITGPLWEESSEALYIASIEGFAVFAINLNKLDNNQARCRWFEMPWRSYDDIVIRRRFNLRLVATGYGFSC